MTFKSTFYTLISKIDYAEYRNDKEFCFIRNENRKICYAFRNYFRTNYAKFVNPRWENVLTQMITVAIYTQKLPVTAKILTKRITKYPAKFAVIAKTNL